MSSVAVRTLIRAFLESDSAEEVVDKWIEGGSAAISSKIVGEAVRIAKINFVYNKKRGFYL